LQQLATQIGEVAHKTQIKDPYWDSNKTGDIRWRIINYYLCRDEFAVRPMNFNANSFSNITNSLSELEVSYPTAATGRSSVEGFEIERRVIFGSTQQEVTISRNTWNL
jgi:hypothetical protein